MNEKYQMNETCKIEKWTFQNSLNERNRKNEWNRENEWDVKDERKLNWTKSEKNEWNPKMNEILEKI